MSDTAAIAAVAGGASVLTATVTGVLAAYTARGLRKAELEKLALQEANKRADSADTFRGYRRGVYNGFLQNLDRLASQIPGDDWAAPTGADQTTYYQALLASGDESAGLIQALWLQASDPGSQTSDDKSFQARRGQLVAALRSDCRPSP
jgi:hypothetical protein